MNKENLIMVHSFPTNSVLLDGLIQYLNDYFDVYFIDLPGFTRHVPPLAEISFRNYSQFIEQQIKSFNLDSYIVAGISFGFWVINNIQHDKTRCKGIIAIEPYIGRDSLRYSTLKRMIYVSFTKIAISTGLSAKIWNNEKFRNYLRGSRKYPSSSINTIFNELDGKTFFKTANLLLSNREGCRFQDFPYVLLINKDDKTIDSQYILKVFSEEVGHLLVVNTTIDHFPEDLSKKYFSQKISEAKINKMINFATNKK